MTQAPFERNPRIPPPPPPPVPKKKRAPELPSLETELTERNRVIHELALQYTNLENRTNQPPPDLAAGVTKYRDQGLFSVQVYDPLHGEAKFPTYNPDKLQATANKSYLGENVFLDSRQEGKYHNHMRELGITEAISLKPVTTFETETRKVTKKVPRSSLVPWLGTKEVPETKKKNVTKPLTFGDVTKFESKYASEPAVQITYHVAGPGYSSNFAHEERKEYGRVREQQPLDRRANGMALPTGKETADIQQRLAQIHSLKNAKGDRESGHVEIAVTLPASKARELWDRLQKHPEEIRYFFIAGGLDQMTYHIPPPYEKWDADNPNRPILAIDRTNSKAVVDPANEKHLFPARK